MAADSGPRDTHALLPELYTPIYYIYLHILVDVCVCEIHTVMGKTCGTR